MSGAADPESITWLRFAIAAVTTLGLLGLLGVGMRIVANRGWLAAQKQTGKRLSVQESLTLDAKHRLVIVKCDEREHLLLLGASQDNLIETIPPKAP